MLKFQKTDRTDMRELAPYFAAQRTHISDFSLGFQCMWSKALGVEHCIAAGCLVLHEVHAGKNYFYYPLSISGEGEDAALDLIERHCRDGNIRLHYTNVPREKLPKLLDRYGRECSVNNRRRWQDYLYRAEDFKTYAGKKYAGQRNHVNKFLKNNPDWEFRVYTERDEPVLRDLLAEVGEAQLEKGEYLAREEYAEACAMLPLFGELGIFCGILYAGGRPVGFSAGERCGDMVVVHLEKAKRAAEGAYPMLAQQFARAFCGDGVEYLNRMDDAGDPGLRKSKLQYLPCELVGKYNVLPKRAIDGLSHLPEIETARLTLAAVKDEDGEEYRRLASDVERNRYWGYDWREDAEISASASDLPTGSDFLPDASYFLRSAREDFARKDEMPLGIYAAGKLVGEVVLHRFGYRDEAEIGVRLLREAEGRGYASEAVSALTEHAFFKLGLACVEGKCFRENARSANMFRRAGFQPCGADGTYFYFRKTPEM